MMRWLVTTKLGWLIISFLWAAAFLIVDDNIESSWAFWTAVPALGYMFGLALVGLAYALVINPLNERKNK